MKKIVLAVVLLMGWLPPASSASYEDLNAGIYFHNQSQWNAAVAAFDKALAAGDLAPNLKFIAYLDRGEAKLRLGQTTAAVADLSASLAIRPGDPQALLWRSMIYLNTGKPQEAAQDLELLIAARPAFAGGYMMRASVYAKLGQLDKSTADLQTMLSLGPANDPRQRLMAGIVAWEAGDTHKARDDFDYSVRHIDTPYGWFWLALAELKLGRAVPRSVVPSYDKAKWPAPLVSFFTGETSEEAVFASAGQGAGEDTEGKSCEANFYIGEWRLQHQDNNGAKAMLEKAASECPAGFIEWIPAQMEFAKLHD